MWRILLWDTRRASPDLHIVRAIEDALEKQPDVSRVWNADHLDALPLARANDCNLLLAVGGEELDPGLCCRLKHVCATSVLWSFGPATEQPIGPQLHTLFDRVFANGATIGESSEPPVVRLPLAASRRFHEYQVPADSDDSSHYRYDLLFAGTATPDRCQFLKELLALAGDLRIKLALQDDEGAAAALLGLPPSAVSWRASSAEIAHMANRSRAVLALGGDVAADEATRAASIRDAQIFELALAGGFLLVDATLVEAARFYEIGSEAVAFSDAHDCVGKLRHYLAAASDRLRIVRAAQQRTLREHLYEHRVRAVLSGLTQPSKASTGHVPRVEPLPRPRRLLVVSHNHLGCSPFGGVEVYVDLLSRSLPEKYEPYVLFPDRAQDPHCAVLQLHDVRRSVRIERRFDAPLGPTALTDPDREAWFGKILHDYRIDLVHFQHLMGHPWSLPLVARSLGVPTLFTVMDFFSVCSHLNLLTVGDRYCDAPRQSSSGCDLCLLEQNRLLRFSQANRRTYIGSVLRAVDAIISLSQSTEDILLEIYPDLRHKARYVEGLPIRDLPAPSKKRPARGGRLRVAVPGNFVRQKGAAALCKVFDTMRDEPIDFFLFGHMDPAYVDALGTLQLQNVFPHGKHSPETSSSQLASCDLALLLSIWPETYTLTLSESWQAGVVPIVTDIGALGERVADGENGFKVPVNDPGAVVHLLRGLLAEPARIDAICRQLHPGLYRSLADHLHILTGIYEKLADEYAVESRSDEFFGHVPQACGAGGAGVHLLRSCWETLPVELGMEPTILVPPPLPPPAPLAPRSRLQRFADHLQHRGWSRTIVRSLEKVLVR